MFSMSDKAYICLFQILFRNTSGFLFTLKTVRTREKIFILPILEILRSENNIVHGFSGVKLHLFDRYLRYLLR